MDKPLITFCAVGKNDDYMEDLIYRMETTCNSLARNVYELKLEQHVEFLFLDWGSEQRISEVVKLNDDSTKVVKFYYLAPSVLKKASMGNDNIHLSKATNAMIRRAAGQYVFVTGCDFVFSKKEIEQLYNFLSGGLNSTKPCKYTGYLIPRSHIPWQFLERQPNIEIFERYVDTCGTQLKYESNINIGGGYGAVGLHKTVWSEIQGLNENFDSWGGSDIELFFLIQKKYSWKDLGELGIRQFHMQHTNKGSRDSKIKESMHSGGNNFPRRKTQNNWGLQNLIIRKEKIITYKKGNSDYAFKNNNISGRKIFEDDLKNESFSRLLRKLFCGGHTSYLQKNPDCDEFYIIFIINRLLNHIYPIKVLDLYSNSINNILTYGYCTPHAEIKALQHKKYGTSIASESGAILKNKLEFKGYIKLIFNECLKTKDIKDKYDFIYINNNYEMTNQDLKRLIDKNLNNNSVIFMKSSMQRKFDFPVVEINLRKGYSYIIPKGLNYEDLNFYKINFSIKILVLCLYLNILNGDLLRSSSLFAKARQICVIILTTLNLMFFISKMKYLK